MLRHTLLGLTVALSLFASTTTTAKAVAVGWNFFSIYRDLSFMQGSFVYDSATNSFSNVAFRYRFGRQFGQYNNSGFNVLDPLSDSFVLTLFPNGVNPAGDLTGIPYLEIDAADFGDPTSRLEFTVIGSCLSPSCIGTLGIDYGIPETLGGFAFLQGRASAASATAAPVIAPALSLTAARAGPVAPVPLPMSGLLFLGALGLMAGMRQFRKTA